MTRIEFERMYLNSLGPWVCELLVLEVNAMKIR